MKTSLVIPCTPEHFLCLPTILHYYRLGTVKPDQVIVSLSQSGEIHEAVRKRVIDTFSSEFDDFILLNHNSQLSHGPNRQAGSSVVSSEIVIYGDADDIPHPMRVETIKHFFKNFDIMHLNHWWCRDDWKFKMFDIKDVDYVDSKKIDELYFWHNDISQVRYKTPGGYGSMLGRVHGGNLAIRRDVLAKVSWKDWGELQLGPAEDWEFCIETANIFKKSMIINVDLIKYVSDTARNVPLSVYDAKTIGAVS